MARRIRRVGQVTRGKTALNPLRRIDTYIALALANCLQPNVLLVDLGYGAQAWTTVEMLTRLSTITPSLRCLGIEIEPERVVSAQPYADPPRLAFQLGGFNIADLTGAGAVSLIRAYNVLRQYDEAEVGIALQTMARALREGGVLIEGTSNPNGKIAVFDVYRQSPSGLRHESLVFATNFSQVELPADFQTILPKRLIHHMRDEPLATFFSAWERAYQHARTHLTETSPPKVWRKAALILHEQYGYPVDRRDRLLRRGFLPLALPLLPPPLL